MWHRTRTRWYGVNHGWHPLCLSDHAFATRMPRQNRSKQAIFGKCSSSQARQRREANAAAMVRWPRHLGVSGGLRRSPASLDPRSIQTGPECLRGNSRFLRVGMTAWEFGQASVGVLCLEALQHFLVAFCGCTVFQQHYVPGSTSRNASGWYGPVRHTVPEAFLKLYQAAILLNPACGYSNADKRLLPFKGVWPRVRLAIQT